MPTIVELFALCDARATANLVRSGHVLRWPFGATVHLAKNGSRSG